MMNFEETQTNTAYPFILDLVNNNEHLKKNFKNGNEEITETTECCDDMRFEISISFNSSFQLSDETGRFPKAYFKKKKNSLT